MYDQIDPLGGFILKIFLDLFFKVWIKPPVVDLITNEALRLYGVFFFHVHDDIKKGVARKRYAFQVFDQFLIYVDGKAVQIIVWPFEFFVEFQQLFSDFILFFGRIGVYVCGEEEVPVRGS